MISFLSEKRVSWFNQAAAVCLLAVWPTLTFSSVLLETFFWTSCAFCLLSLIGSRQWPILPDRLSLILIGFFFLAVLISMTVSDYPKQSFRGLIKVIRQIVIFILVFHLFQSAGLKSNLRLVALFSFLLLLSDGAYQFFTGTDFLRGFPAQDASSGKRLSAGLQQYGKLAAYLCTVLPLIMGWTLNAYRNPKLRQQLWYWLPLSLGGIVLLFMTRSRGAFLALFIGLMVMLILRRAWKTILIFVLAGALFVSILPRSMVIHLDRENKEQSLIERFELWNRAWDVIEARPLTGTGINTYAVAHQQFDKRKSWRVQNYYAHNGYLQIGAEIGLPGLFFLIFFFLRWAWIHRPQSFEKNPETEIRWGLFVGMISFMVACLADTAMHSLQPVMAFWFVVGLLGAFHSRPQT